MDDPQTQFHGPFAQVVATVDGYRVPNITVTALAGESDGQMNVVLDGRFTVLADEAEARRWLPLLAHAMAVAAGYTCHGEHSERANPFAVQLRQIDSLD